MERSAFTTIREMYAPAKAVFYFLVGTGILSVGALAYLSLP